MKREGPNGVSDPGNENGADPSFSSHPPSPFVVVGVGASAGGLEAFTELLGQIPENSGMAFVLIQHLDPTHPSYLSEALARSAKVPVHEISDGTQVLPNHVYVIPSNADVGILHGTLTLLPRSAPAGKPHLPIDFFFKALAADRGHQAIGVVLSGTGSDGSEGLRAIKAEDGVTFAQNPASAKFSGMPASAIEGGVVDFALPIPELAQNLLRVGQHPLVRDAETDVLTSPADGGELKKVLVILRNTVGIDFSEYKPASVRRRLARRMALHRQMALRDYVHMLRDSPAEAQALVDDMLIPVTSFFRDGEPFTRLRERVFPEILKQKRDGGTIRIWSAGCSTGEEAYSVVMVLLEFLAEENAPEVPVQLFGTDVSEKAIDKARAGVFSEGIAKEVGPERLARFFTRLEGGGYAINKFVRERCAFVKHNLASDPPFSRIDLVTCRNVLIYFNQELQKRVLTAFQFALNQPGFLLLGRAENLGDGANLFSWVDREFKIFARTTVKSSLRLAPTRDVLPSLPQPAARGGVAPSPADVIRRAESVLLDLFAPPGVIVNDRMEILHFRGRTGPYLEPAPGQPQHDLLKMARKGLLAEIRIAVSQAKRGNSTVRRAGVRVDDDGVTRICDLLVVPITTPPQSREHIFAVLFGESSGPEREAAVQRVESSSPSTTDERQLGKLEAELHATKEYLQSLIDDHQRTNEELMSANEELVSSNEELQTLNEELQTAKEELQSTNEELSTLNEELQTRNAEINLANSDLINILGSVEIPIVIVDAKRRIRRFTPKARPILNLLPADVGRPIDDIKPSIAIEDLDGKITDVIDMVHLHEEEALGRDGRWYRLQIRPYTTTDKRIDGAVLSIVDIDVLRRALGAAEWARDYAKATVEAVQVPLLVLDEQFKVLSTNEAFREAYALPAAQSENRSVYEIMGAACAIPALRTALDQTADHRETFRALQVECEIAPLGERSLSFSGRSVPAPGGGQMILLAVEDITDRLRAESERTRLLEDARTAKASAEEANRTKDIFLATLSHELRTPLSSLLLFAQLLRHGKMDEARLHKAAESIERATKAQAQLIDDLLDISRVVTGKLKMERLAIDLGSVVRAAVETVGPTAEGKHLALAVSVDEDLVPVWGDPARLQQVVLNLLTNSIKFTPEGGCVTVRVDAEAGQGRVRVADTGIGIDAEFLPHLFNRFSQEHQGSTRAQGGLGLGLAIVRYLVEAHGGTATAESAGRGKGATFTVLLPLMEEHARVLVRKEQEPASHERALAIIKGAPILVVEDDEGTREALADMLRLNGAEVRTADSAARAMTVFEAWKPDLLVCDIAMPGEDGYSLLARIRALGAARGGNVPAIALTALAGEEDRRRALESGFQAHIAKPIEIDRLVEVLAALRSRSPRVAVSNAGLSSSPEIN